MATVEKQAGASPADRVGDGQQCEYLVGFIAGLTAYAWWNHGTQYVGTCGTTLKRAIERAIQESPIRPPFRRE